MNDPLRVDLPVMPFGTYAGMAFYELVADHLDYVEWLLNQEWLDAAVAAKLRTAIAEHEDEERCYAPDDDDDGL
jgi:hypothetical protein